MLRKWMLATALTLVFAVGARADFLYETTQVTLVAPYGGAADVTGLVNGAGGNGTGLSYTASSGLPGSGVYATGAELLGTYALYNGGTGVFNSASLVLDFALTGHVIPPVGGAAFSAMFDTGTLSIYSVASNSFNQQQTGTWGPTGGTLLYSAAVSAPNATFQGPLGDPNYNGQPATGQNQASFFPSSGTASLGAVVGLTSFNNDALFAPPQTFSGFQFTLSETNALTSTYNQVTHPNNAQLDANYDTLTGLTTTPFADHLYAQTANVAGPNTLQHIGGTAYPVLAVPTPEPASILLLSFGAIGFGVYARRQRKGIPA